MLVKQLKQVIEIDERINTIHRELSDLYSQRAQITEEKDIPEIASKKEDSEELSQDRWVSKQYQKLSSTWQNCDIKIPSKKTLLPKLIKAHELIVELSAKAPDLEGKLSVLLVPPHKQFPFPVNSALREKQDSISASDFVNPEYPSVKKSKAWKVLVVYGAHQGLYLGNAEMILENKSYMFSNHDMRDLGIREYAALSSQEKDIDKQSWTMFLQDQQASEDTVAIAGCIDDRYRFDLTETNSIFSDDRFRPAIEV
jgi:hypothetical protein